MNKKTVNILGIKWTVVQKEFKEDYMDGYTDYTIREIGIRSNNIGDVADFEELMKQNLRHEIIHAFLAESGLRANWEHSMCGHDETVVDWIAIQFPKILKVYEELGCL